VFSAVFLRSSGKNRQKITTGAQPGAYIIPESQAETGMRVPGTILLILVSFFTSGCTIIVSRAADSFGSNLTSAILNQDDPETVKAGMPSYMLLMDSFVEGSPDSPTMLGAASSLYASYGGLFADDETRARRLTRRARTYASDAMCHSFAESCHWDELTFQEFEASLGGVAESEAKALYTYGFALLAYIRAHADDFDALAELPQAEAILIRYIELVGDAANPAAFNYLGILQTLRPPMYGGKPEEARANFEKAIELTGGQDLSVKVEFARGYARTMYDQELHDQLVAEVLQASPYADGFTLLNVLAQEQALELARTAPDYF
jgi:hypothetical protein